MEKFFAALGKDLYERIVVSNKSTIIGWLIGGGIYAADAAAAALTGWHSPYAPAAALVVGFAGTALKNKAKVAAIGPLLVLALLLGAAPARAQATATTATVVSTPVAPDVSPAVPLGACWKGGLLCVAPAIALPALTLSFKTGQLGTSVGGAGYELIWSSDKDPSSIKAIGFGGYVTARTGSVQSLSLDGRFRFLRYGSVGLNVLTGANHDIGMILGFGTGVPSASPAMGQ